MKNFLITASLLFATLSFAQPILHTETHLAEPDDAPAEHVLNIEREKVEVSFEPKQGLVNGKVTHYFVVLRENVDSIFFNAVKIRIKEARLGGKPVRFVSSENSVIVYPDKPMKWDTRDSISFTYECNPRRGVYFIGWNDPKNLSRKQIWTQGQGIDNRHWIPSYDEYNDKMITETVTTFDKEYEVLSNGTKVSVKDNGDGTKTWHYRMSHPHSPYLLMLGIGKYAIDNRTTKAGVPVHLYYYPEFPERMEPTYRYSTEAIDFVANWTGIPYPWESYSQIMVQDFIYGAMENTTATVFGDFFNVDKRGFIDRNYIGVNVHELTHQWFGDLVTCRAGMHNWLQESYATFFPKMFTRDYFGQDAFEWNKRGEQNGLIAANDADRYPIVHPKMGTARVYGGGSAVLGMMCYTFGEDAVKRVINHYVKNHMYKNVETNDLYQSFQDTLGLAPDWFFDQWLYRGGYPIYDVKYQDANVNGQRTTQITVAQTHHTDELTKLFKMPVVFDVHYTDGTNTSTRQIVEKQTETINVPNPSGKSISYVLFDPGSNIVKKVNFKKNFAELKAQALGAPNMIDRYDAIVALKSDSSSASAKRDLLIQLYNKETYQATRSEIVSQLSQDISSEARSIIKRAVKDSAVEVRSAAVNAYRFIPKDLEADMRPLLNDSSFNVIVTSLDKMCESFPENKSTYLDLTKNEEGPSKKCRIKWLEIKAGMGDKDAFRELNEYVSSSYEFGTRNNAIASLQKLNHLDNDGLANLIEAYLSTNNRLAGNAYTALNTFYGELPYRDMMTTYYKSKTWEPWQKDILQNVFK